jgi:dTDP-4-dehydrorhamnose reductase
MTDLLVIGAGLLGRYVARAAVGRFETALTYNATPSKVEGCSSYPMDIMGNLDLIDSLSPDYIVLTSAQTNVDQCEVDPKKAWAINALGAGRVAAKSREVGAKLAYVSTDYVFDGDRGDYREEENTAPINCYGQSKLEGERLVQEACRDCLIARTSVLYGLNPVRSNFVTWVREELRRGNSINVVEDQYTCPTFADNLAQMILIAIDEFGIFHTSGSERINRFDFALKIARTFDLDEHLIKPILSDGLSWKARRPKDSSLNTSKISRYAKPLNVSEGLKSMAEEAKVNL